MKPPLVSGILPFADARRLNLVRKAVNNFIRQHYTPYELVIVNGTNTDVLTNDEMDTLTFQNMGCQVTEIRVQKGLNAAAMRNRGINVSHGDWIFPVDDDDWCHPQRLLFQMAHRVDGHPCLLRQQLRIDVSESLTSSAEDQPVGSFKPLLHLLNRINGVPSTILFPKYKRKLVKIVGDRVTWADDKEDQWLYDESLNIGEHDELLARMRQENAAAVICDNSHTVFVTGMQWPILSIAIYHADNELSYENFFVDMAEPVDRTVVPIGLTATDIEQLRVVLQSYNFRIQ